MSKYPDEPGFKEGDTSREAAESMSLRAIKLRKLCYDLIRKYPGHTADEIADLVGESLLAIRPRISELRRMQYVRNHGRGSNRSGMAAHRWVVCEDVDVTAAAINERWADLRRDSARQIRRRYVAALNVFMDRIECGDEHAAGELKAELDEMRLVLDQSYEWVR
jgi:hypothetical protein